MAEWIETNVNGYNVYAYDGNDWVAVNKTYAYWGSTPVQNDWFVYDSSVIRGLTARYENGQPVYDAKYGYGQEDMTIPNDCTSLTDSAFIRLKNVDTDAENIVIPNSALQTLYIPDSITTLTNGSVAQCVALREVRLPNEITEIPFHLFYNGASLESVKIPHKVASIGAYTFTGCVNLSKLYFIRDSSYTGKISIPVGIFDSVITPFEMYFSCSQTEAENLFDFGSGINIEYTQETFANATKYYNQVITNE